MKKIIFLSLSLTGLLCIGQSSERFSIIAFPYHRTLYYNVPNKLEFLSSTDYDSSWLELNGGYATMVSPNTAIIVPTDKYQRTLTIHIAGLRGKDTIREAGFDFAVSYLPDPLIHLGYNHIDLQTDLNNYSDTAIFESLFFSAHFQAPLERYMQPDWQFTIAQFKLILGDKSIPVKGHGITDSLFQEIGALKKGTRIQFTDFEVNYPDGRTKILSFDTIYVKKTKAGIMIPRKKISLKPEEG